MNFLQEFSNLNSGEYEAICTLCPNNIIHGLVGLSVITIALTNLSASFGCPTQSVRTADTNCRNGRHKVFEHLTQSVRASDTKCLSIRHKVSEHPTQSVRASDTKCPSIRHKVSEHLTQSVRASDSKCQSIRHTVSEHPPQSV